jgi:hypothetical protein
VLTESEFQAGIADDKQTLDPRQWKRQIGMKVFIANFGTGNFAWGDCLQRSTIAVMIDVRVHAFWQQGDREGFVAEAQRVLKTKARTPIIAGVATRWFNTNNEMTQTYGDIWIHREKDQLWWTESLDQPATSEVIPDPHPRDIQNQIVVYHKPCKLWSTKSRKGGGLPPWTGIHPKAREFLFTEGICQQLSPDNALYAKALINGDDLSFWHSRSDWRARADKSGKGAVTVASPARLSATAMADSAWQTAAQSGTVTLSVSKLKAFGFTTKRELEDYLLELIEGQEGLCALTGLELRHYGTDSHPDFRCSLDRIDSAGHYERGNLQVVCWFANRWKGSSDNEGFKRLISVVRGEATH